MWLRKWLREHPSILVFDGLDEFFINNVWIDSEIIGDMLKCFGRTLRDETTATKSHTAVLAIRNSYPGHRQFATKTTYIFTIEKLTSAQAYGGVFSAVASSSSGPATARGTAAGLKDLIEHALPALDRLCALTKIVSLPLRLIQHSSISSNYCSADERLDGVQRIDFAAFGIATSVAERVN